jgi:NADH-quinone oxidoreductase subunit L
MIAMTFLGNRSHHIEELENEGHPVHEAPRVMWFPYAVLASATLVIGLVGPFVEELLHGVFSGSLPSGSAGLEAVLAGSQATDGISVNVVAVALSVTMLVVGGLPAYLIYVKHQIDQTEVLREHRALRMIHGFLWNRWYLNATYYKIFVNGTLEFAFRCFKAMEVGIFDQINWKVAGAATYANDRIKRIQTGVLSYNMAYVALFLLLLLLLMRVMFSA